MQAGRLEPEGGGEDASSEGGSWSGGAGDEDQGGENDADGCSLPESAVVCEPELASLERDPDRGDGDQQQQDSLGLPVKFGLVRARIRMGRVRRGRTR